MEKVVRRTALVMITALGLFICILPGYAGDSVFQTCRIQATGESRISLPAIITKDGVDGVVVERDGKPAPITFSVTGSDLYITPFIDFEGGTACNVKIFTKNGKRYLIKGNIEPFTKFDASRDNIIKMPAKPSKGINYEYYLYVPPGIDKLKDRRLIVNCLNTSPSTNRESLGEQAKEQASRNSVTHFARILQTPCIVPAFPRESYAGNDDYVYAQMLNKGAVQKEKVDVQLLAMIKDAQEELKYNGIHVDDKVFICGFSTDAKFAQRFTILHPDVVMPNAAGLIAGTTTFPIAEYKGEKLGYPVGVADFKTLTGRDFDKDEYTKVPQFFYMGETDTNDVTEWRDCLPQKDAEQIWRLFGRRQMPDRWNVTQQILADIAPNIKCKTYPGIGHSVTKEVMNDIVEFFKEHWSR